MELQEILQRCGDDSVESIDTRLLVNIRGCNGAGKSTIPMMMRDADPDTFEIDWYINGRKKVLATVFPNYKFLALGSYKTGVNCGGLDTFKTTQHTIYALKLLWNLPYNILLEGIMASTVRQTYIDLFHEVNSENILKRDIIIYNILPPLQVCLDRVQKRNGGKPVKEEQIGSKWNTVEKNVKYFEDAGFRSLRVSNENVAPGETLKWFFDEIGINPHTSEENHQKNKNKPAVKAEKEPSEEEYAEVYIEPEENLTGYDWYEDYKAPNSSLRMKKKYFDSYWNFITERMNIYHKRVVLGEPAPWTDDPILQQYKFTNVLRDMDKLSIYERKNILAKLDEPCKDLTMRKKSVLLSMMMFRLWVKTDTYEVHGFIDLENPNWKKDWEKAKKVLLQRREDGVSNFTAAFYVNDLHAANPDKATQSNKTMNAICMIEGWMNNIDAVYEGAIVKPKNMKEQLKYFQTLPCVGHFTAYEYADSITMATRYCKNHLVEWTQDNATNVGPGAKRGIDWIFENKGGMSDYQCILYLRSIWRHELQRLGTYDRFVSQLPKELHGDIDLRVIEHCLCETQKYNKAWTGTGRPKEAFKPKTQNLSELLV